LRMETKKIRYYMQTGRQLMVSRMISTSAGERQNDLLPPAAVLAGNRRTDT